MDRKLFKDVFPDLKLDNKIKDIISETEVEKITMFKSKRKMVISFVSKNLIAKKLIYRAEAAISEFIFGNPESCVIEDRYELSKQYNLTQLTNIYKDSFLEEIKQVSYVDFRLLNKAEWYYNENILTLALDDSNLSKSQL